MSFLKKNLAYILVVFLSLAGFSSLTKAEEIPVPNGDTLLVMTGEIANANVGNELHLGRYFIKNLPQVEIKTHTPWQDGLQTFKGPLLRDVLELAGLKSGEIDAIASNNYQITFPIQDAYDHDVILAIELNGKAMSLRNKGPLWVIYPWDENPDLQLEEYYSRSIWQLIKITAK